MPFSVDRIDRLVINCRDVESTVDWYVRVLGMTRLPYGEGRVAHEVATYRPAG